MEPALIRKYLVYLRKKDKGTVRPSPRVNDSGVTLVDMQSNDCWSIAFLLLLTHDPRFAFCYKYKPDNDDGCPIRFDREVFVKLFNKVLRKFRTDRNFCYVLGRLCGFYRFQGDERASRGDDEDETLEPVEYNRRDLKFFVWLLTYAGFPERKVVKFEDGESLREIDEYDTMASNASLYESVEEPPLESQVKQYMTNKQILETLDQKNNIIEKVLHEESKEPETAPFLATLYEEPTYSFFEQKSYIQSQKKSKKIAPKKKPVQKMQVLAQFTYQKPAKTDNQNLLYNYAQGDDDSEEALDDSHFSIDHITATNAMKDVKISKIKDKITNIPSFLSPFEVPRDLPLRPARPLPPPPGRGSQSKSPVPFKRFEEQVVEYTEPVSEAKYLEPRAKRRATRKDKRVDSDQYGEKVIASLARVSRRQLHVTDLDELELPTPKPVRKRSNGHDNDQENNCRCPLCTKASSRVRRQPKVIRPPLAQFDTKKSAEELKKDRLESRIKRVSRVKYRAPKYEDPYYQNPRYAIGRRLNTQREKDDTDDLVRISRHETSHYKTSKLRRLKLEMKRNKSQGKG